MARTHGASNRFHQDDGVVLGKGGVPIPTTPIRGIPTMHPHGSPSPNVQHMDDGEIVPPVVTAPVASAPVATTYVFECNKTTWQRNMDGFQAMHLLNAMLGNLLGSELSVTLTYEQVQSLPPDVRWHFRRKTIVAPVEPDETI